jgi:mitochondrial fission protein ELM1
MFWAGPEDGDNPYAGILAWADRIVVTPDSVNMISEACASGKPVHAFATRPIIGKLGEFHRGLVDGGYLSAIDAPAPANTHSLREITHVTARIREAWKQARVPWR